jgi:hypothetical protein
MKTTNAKTFISRLKEYTLPSDSLDQMELFISIIDKIDPSAIFDLETARGLIVLFTDGSKANVLGEDDILGAEIH